MEDIDEDGVEGARLGLGGILVVVDELPDDGHRHEGDGHWHEDQGLDRLLVSHAVSEDGEKQTEYQHQARVKKQPQKVVPQHNQDSTVGKEPREVAQSDEGAAMSVEETSHDGADDGVDEDDTDEEDGWSHPYPGTNGRLAALRQPSHQHVGTDDVAHQGKRDRHDHKQERRQIERPQRRPVDLQHWHPGDQAEAPVHAAIPLLSVSDYGDA